MIAVERSTDDAGFAAFFDHEYGRLCRALLLLSGSHAEAEDLAQEALTRAYERWDRVREMASPVGYVYRTALNLNRKRLRRLRVWHRIRASAPPADDPAAGIEARDELLRALARLRAPEREAVVLVEWLGLDANEAGRLLGIAAATVRGRLHRARVSLRDVAGGNDE